MCAAVAPQHRFARLKSLTLDRLLPEPLIAYRRDEYPGYHESIEKIFSPFGRAPRVAEEHDGITSLIAAVEAGHGIAFVSESTVCLAGQRVKLIPVAGVPPIPVGAVWKNQLPLVEKFIAAAAASRSVPDVHQP